MTGTVQRYRTKRAVLAIIIAVLALSLGDAIIKASSLSLPLWQMYILRSALVVPVLWWLARRDGFKPFGSPFWVAMRSMLLVVMWLSYYVALPLMPLSLAAAAYYTSPILITVIAAIVVGGTSIAGGEGSIWRTVLGAFFIAFMVNGFNLHQVDPIFQRIVQGTVILGAVAVDSWSRSRRA